MEHSSARGMLEGTGPTLENCQFLQPIPINSCQYITAEDSNSTP